jgi:hypothetical protein
LPTKFKGNIQVTEHLYEILTAISARKKEEKEGRAPTGHLFNFDRLIDPVIVATFFGLYKSRELPPLDADEYPLEKSYEFGNVDISDFADKLNHFLFCLWVKQNGLPNINENILDYRESLYKFISKIISDRYFVGVVIPFYVKKADAPEAEKSSFLHRLWSSDNIQMISEMYSPEYLSSEFDMAQNEFVNDVIAAAAQLQSVQPKSKLEVLLSQDEGQTLEFKSTFRYDIKAAEHGIDKVNPVLEREILKEICAFLNSEGGTILIGVSDDKKILGLSNDYKHLPMKKDKDGFEVFLRNKLTQCLQPEIPGLVKILFERQNDLEICRVEIEKSSEPIFLKVAIEGKEIGEFWIREGNSIRQLVGPAMVEYIRKRWST